MASLQTQIDSLFKGIEPDVFELVTRVIEIEKEFLHLERPHGVMEKIEGALDSVAQNSLKNEAHQ
ncbi:MAG: hypothetical protein L6Q98_20355 [Anaerolineae bacterium]|nr:hypothetical protein [Anaerolineae bacterium]